MPTQLLSEDLPREVAPGVWWLGACSPIEIAGQTVHGHDSCYLVIGSKQTLLFDTGPETDWPAHEQTLEEKLAGRTLDFVVPSHPEVPHTGALGRLVAKYPDVRVVGDVRDYHLYYPHVSPRLEAHVEGDRFDLGGIEFVLCDAMIRDLPNTQWGYIPSLRTLFTTDGFCYLHHPELDKEDPRHLPGECGLTTSELKVPPTVENVAFFSGSAIYWARFVDDAEERYARIFDFVQEIGAQVLCPTHGNVITDVDDIADVVRKAHKQAYRYRDQTGGGNGAA